MADGDFPPDIACVSENNTINEIKFSDGYQYDAVCPHDNLHFKSVQDWKNHHFNNHMDTKWKCPLCATVSASWYNYAYHVQIQEHNSTCPPPWICKLKVSPKLSKNKKAHSTINRCTPHMSHSPERKLCEKRSLTERDIDWMHPSPHNRSRKDALIKNTVNLRFTVSNYCFRLQCLSRN
eukprot:359268_1